MNKHRIPEAPSDNGIDDTNDSPFTISQNKTTLVVTNTNESLLGLYECRVVDQNYEAVTNVYHFLLNSSRPETTIHSVVILPEGI